MKKILLPFLITIFSISGFAQISTVELIGGVGGKDAFLSHGSGEDSVNFNTYDDFGGDTWTCGGNPCLGRGLIKFDLSTIEPYDTLVSAYLMLYANPNSTEDGYIGQPTYGSNNAGWLRRVTASWSIDSVSWANQPSNSQINQVTLPQSDTVLENYLNIDVTALVGDMLADGNYGFLIMEQNETTPYNSLLFYSSSTVDSTVRPALWINYKIGNPAPAGIADPHAPSPLCYLYPNPATDLLSIKSSSRMGQALNNSYSIADVTGRILQNGHLEAETTTLNIKVLDAGIYFIKIFSEQESQTFKIVKQ